MNIKPLRTLTIASIVNESFSQSLLEEIQTLPQTLVEEIQILLKLRDIYIYDFSACLIQCALQFMYIDADDEFISMSDFNEVICMIYHWINVLKMQIEKKMKENDAEAEKLWKSLPRDYRSSINFFKSVPNKLCNDDAITYEINQKLLVIADEHFTKKIQKRIERVNEWCLDAKEKEARLSENIKTLNEDRCFAERVLNRIKFPLDGTLDPSEYS